MFLVAFDHLLPLLGLHHGDVFRLLDFGDFVHQHHPLIEQLAQLVVHIFQEGALFHQIQIRGVRAQVQTGDQRRPLRGGQLLLRVGECLRGIVVALDHQPVKAVVHG